MIRANLKNKLSNLTSTIIEKQQELDDLEEKRENAMELYNINYKIKDDVKYISLFAFIIVINTTLFIAVGSLATFPLNIATILSPVIDIICLPPLVSVIKEFNKKLNVIHKHGYKYRDTFNKWHRGTYKIGGVKESKIANDFDEEVFLPLGKTIQELEEVERTKRILFNILSAEEIVDQFENYNNKYKNGDISKIYGHANYPLIEDILKQEWEEYLKYLETIKPEEVHFSSFANGKIETEKKKTLSKSHDLSIYE